MPSPEGLSGDCLKTRVVGWAGLGREMDRVGLGWMWQGWARVGPGWI